MENNPDNIHPPKKGAMPAKSEDEIQSRRLQPEDDLEQIVELFDLVFQRRVTPQLWKWKYMPPWGKPPYAWIGEVDGRIFGHIGTAMLRGVVDGHQTPFFQLGDIMVHPDFRGKYDYLGLAPTKIFEEIQQEHPSAIFYGFAVKRLARWYQRAGLSAFLEEADDRLVRLTGDDQPTPGANIEIRPWAWNAVELDSLWRQLKHTVKIGLVRDELYLRWRYGSHPQYQYSLWGVYVDQNPVGWMVTDLRQQNPGEPVDEVRVQDLLLPPQMRLSVLQEAARSLGAKTLVLWLPSNSWPADMPGRDTTWVVMHHCWRSSLSLEELKQNFYYTLGEADQWWW